MCVYYCVGTGNSIFLFLFGTGKIINTLSIKHQCRGNGKGFEIRVGGLLLIEIGEWRERKKIVQLKTVREVVCRKWRTTSNSPNEYCHRLGTDTQVRK